MSACRFIRCQSDAYAYAWDGVRWVRLCGDHLAGLARVVDLGVYTVAWDVDVDGPPPPTAGPTRRVADNLDTPAPKPTPLEVSDAPLTDATAGATTPAAPVADTDTDTDTSPEPPCTSSTSSSTSSAPAPSGSDAGASGPAAESSPSPSADPPPKRKPGGSKPKFPTVTRRTDDAPDLCLNTGCTSPRKSRGLCHRCFERADRQGVLDAVALPKLSPSEVSRLALAAKHTPKDPPMPPRRSTKPADLVLRENPDRTPKLCRIKGCGKPTKARGFCSSCVERVRNAGRLDELGRPAGVNTGRRREPASKPRDMEADDPLQKIRVILGCDPDGADQEVVDRAKRFVQFRDPVEIAVFGVGAPGSRLLGEIVNAVVVIAGERDLARDEVFRLNNLRSDLLAVTGSTHWEQDPDRTREGLVRAVLELKGKSVELAEAHASLDAMPASSAPECDTPAQRIKYATHAWLDERREASHLAQLCQDAHDALTLEGVPNEGTPADRIRALALRVESTDLDLHLLRDALHLDARTPDLTVLQVAVDRLMDEPKSSPLAERVRMGAVASLLNDIEDRANHNEPTSAHVVNALRALLGVPS